MKNNAFKPAFIFNHNMVLQQGKEVHIYGTGGNQNIAVTVNFNGQTVRAYPNEQGKWLVSLAPMPINATGQPLTITHGNEEITFHNILVGEVWYCSGQSNMAMTFHELLEKRNLVNIEDYSLTPFRDYQKYQNYDKIRIYHQAFHSVDHEDCMGLIRDKMLNGWFIPNRVEDLGDYSPYAVGFALRLQEALKIPVGVIVSAVGGSSIEEWLSCDTIKDNGLKLHYTNETKPHSKLYNGMAYPLNDFTVAGLLWYQGCADSGKDKVDNWKVDMVALCAQFRKYHGEVPIISQSLVQYNESVEWKYIRQSNYDLMREIDGFYAINGISAGMPNEKDTPIDFTNWIHPADKYGISKDGAEIALTNVYGMQGYNGVAEYPVRVKKENGNLIIYFKEGVHLTLNAGVTVNNLEGFNGNTWQVLQNATIDGNRIVVLGGSTYQKVRYANYNVMMQGATKIANSQYNSETPINLYSTKQGCADLAIFPFLLTVF